MITKDVLIANLVKYIEILCVFIMVIFFSRMLGIYLASEFEKPFAYGATMFVSGSFFRDYFLYRIRD